jgi:hypothetical protein
VAERTQSVAKLLADAKTVAGDRAVDAAQKNDYRKAHEWTRIAGEADALLRAAVAEMARA